MDFHVFSLPSDGLCPICMCNSGADSGYGTCGVCYRLCQDLAAGNIGAFDAIQARRIGGCQRRDRESRRVARANQST